MLQEEKQGLPPQEKMVIKAVSVPGSKVVEGVAYYLVKVTGAFNSWCVAKRYSHFEELQGAISEVKGFPSNLDLPPKRFKFFCFSHIAIFLRGTEGSLGKLLKETRCHRRHSEE